MKIEGKDQPIYFKNVMSVETQKIMVDMTYSRQESNVGNYDLTFLLIYNAILDYVLGNKTVVCEEQDNFSICF